MRFDILQVSWSPDGQWLAISDKPSPQEPFSIFAVSFDSGERRRLTSPAAEITGDLTPAVSPDGKMIAYKHFESGGISEIYLMPVAGGESKRLTFSDIVKSSPVWMPDGRDLLFLSESGSNIGLWRVPTAGGTPERVEAVGQAVTSFAISPQRNRLAWAQTINDSNIWQVDLSAVAAPTGLKPSAKMLISSTKGDVSSQFSPDGKRIAFASTRSGRSAIWVADSTGEHPFQVASFDRGAAGSPRWSPDGQGLVFDAAWKATPIFT
jgi:Tol biopolymer transport system component